MKECYYLLLISSKYYLVNLTMQKKDVFVTFCNFSSKYVTSASKLFLFSNETHYYTHVALTLRFIERKLYL